MATNNTFSVLKPMMKDTYAPKKLKKIKPPKVPKFKELK